MPANKMPEMPEAVAFLVTMPSGKVRGYYDDKLTAIALSMPNDTITDLYTADQMRAMYLAGIADARACVPEAYSQIDALKGRVGQDEAVGHNSCRRATLTNLTALEQEAKK